MREKLAPTNTRDSAKAAGFVPVTKRLNLRHEKGLQTAIRAVEDSEPLFEWTTVLRPDGYIEVWARRRR